MESEPREGFAQKAQISQGSALPAEDELGVTKQEMAARATQQLTLGQHHLQQNRPEAALVALRSSQSLAAGVGETRVQMLASRLLGNVFAQLGELAEALQQFQGALELAVSLRERKQEAMCRNNLGITFDTLGQFEKALEFLHESLVLKRELGDLRGLAYGQNNLGNLLLKLGRLEEAGEAYRQGLKLARELEDQGLEGNILANQGSLFHRQRRAAEAEHRFHEALELFEQLGREEEMAQPLHNLGTLLSDLDKTGDAALVFQRCLELAERFSDLPGAANAQLSFIDNALISPELLPEDLPHLLDRWEAGFELAHRLQDRDLLARFHQCRGRLEERRANYQEALRHWKIYTGLQTQEQNSQSAKRLESLLVAHQVETLRRESEFREREAVLARQAQVEAEKASGAKSRFVANLSHEFRTPLHGILGLTRLLLERELAAEEVDYVESIHSSAESLLGLVNDVLDLSSIEAEKFPIRRTTFALKGLLHDVLGLLRGVASQKSIHLEMESGPDLPEFIQADATRLRQVLINLLGNALKFTPPFGSVWLRIRLQDSWLEFQVEDTGIGMSSESMSQLFQPFFQVHNDDAPELSGTGLGLALSKRLVELMGGTINVESREGQGAIFLVRLPLHPAESTTEQVDSESNGEDLILPDGRRPKVLAAEDHPVNQLLLKKFLQAAHVDYHLVENGQEALELLSENRYDLLLLDCHMPVLDGFETARQIRKLGLLPPEIPILALTASTREADRKKCRQAGMNSVLPKPYSKTQLLEFIQKHLPRKP